MQYSCSLSAQFALSIYDFDKQKEKVYKKVLFLWVCQRNCCNSLKIGVRVRKCTLCYWFYVDLGKLIL